jgi:23S rRNA pseudouridine2605 synthase
MMEGERLQKVLARAGVGSRRAVEELVAAGRVSVNGRPAALGRRIDPSKDKVEVDGSIVPLDARLKYYLVNKPAGVITTAADPHGRATVLDYFDPTLRVWPVGRLDADTEGALVVTNDGDLTHRLTHPSFGVPKSYLVEVRGTVTRSVIRELETGVDLDDGRAAPALARIVDRGQAATLIEVTIPEGRNRQVRRMFETLGYPVTRLVRIRIGPLELGRLKPGTVRRLGPEEVAALYAAGAKET